MPMNTEHEVLREEDHLTAATRVLDMDALDRLYADDILFTGVTGVTCGKAGLMDEARRGAAARQEAGPGDGPVVAGYDKEDLRVAALGDAAVATFGFVVTIRHQGQEIRRRYRTTNVWVKRPRGWQVIAGHTSSADPA